MKRLLPLLLISTAMGQTPIQNATVNDLVEKLAPAEEQSKTRSLRNLQPKPKSIDLVIQFDLDSAKLKDISKPLLDNLATAMKSDRLMSIKFKVEGHTDAQGSQEHNLRLSQNRAESVIAYMSNQGIDKERLVGEGRGFSELLVPDKPKAAENRRVRITTQP